jgi:predicted nucleotidyltransferase
VATKILNPQEVDVILAFIKEKISCIKKIGVTGSYATGQQSITSDLDIVIDINQEDIASFWNAAEEIREILINNFMLPIDFIFYNNVAKKSLQRDCWLSSLEADMCSEMIGKIKWLEEV